MKFFDRIFGSRSETASGDAAASWPVPDPANEEDYVRACSEPAFVDENEQRTFRSDPAFQGVLDPLNSRNYKAAIKAAEGVLRRVSDFDLPYKWLGSAYRATGQLQRSQEVLGQGLTKSKRKSILLTDMGETAWRMGNIHGALYFWSQAAHCLATATNPIDYNAYLLLSYVANGCGLNDVEEKLLNRVDAMKPGQVRLDAATAGRLTSLVREKSDSAMKRAIEAIARNKLYARSLLAAVSKGIMSSQICGVCGESYNHANQTPVLVINLKDWEHDLGGYCSRCRLYLCPKHVHLVTYGTVEVLGSKHDAYERECVTCKMRLTDKEGDDPVAPPPSVWLGKEIVVSAV